MPLWAANTKPMKSIMVSVTVSTLARLETVFEA